MSGSAQHGKRAARARSLRRLVRRLLAEWRAGRNGEDCMTELSQRFMQEASE